MNLLTFIPLTQGGEKRETISRVLDELSASQQNDLILAAYILASLRLSREGSPDLDWLIRRFRDMHDIIEDTPIYQEILQRGRAEGRLEALRQTSVAIIQQRFPQWVPLARKQVSQVQNADRLQQLIVQLSVIQSAEDLQRELLALDEED